MALRAERRRYKWTAAWIAGASVNIPVRKDSRSARAARLALVGEIFSSTAVVRAANGLAAVVALPRAFVLGEAIVQAGERRKAPVADRAVDRWFFVVVVGHWRSSETNPGQG